MNLDINNLELDDNERIVIPDGDYRFRVLSHEVGYSTSPKLPPNTQVLKVDLAIPYKGREVQVRTSFNVYSRALFRIREFAEAVGIMPEMGKCKLDLDKLDGTSGICLISSREYEGNTYNDPKRFYPPSKAPCTTLNDGDWGKAAESEGFQELPDFDLPLPF